MARWKMTSKRPPEEGATVLCAWGPEPVCYGVAVYARAGHWHDVDDDEDDYRDPEFWTELPASPYAASSEEKK